MACQTLLESIHYDVIHVQDIIAARALFRLKGATTPIITTLHSPLAQDYEFNGVLTPEGQEAYRYFQRLESLNLSSSTAIIVPSRHYHDLIPHAHSANAGTIVTIPHGMAWPPGLDAPPPNAKDATPRIITCVARLDGQKGLDYLLQSAKRLLDHPTAWEMWIVGDGPLRSALTQLSLELGLTARIRFLGTRSDVRSLLAQTDIFVLPSLWENMPFALAEAQSSGLAIVATAVGGVPEIIADQETGLLVPPKAPEALARAIGTLLSDDDLRTRLGANAQRTALQQWDARRMTRATVNVYRNAIKTHAGQPHGPSSALLPDDEIFRL